MKKIPGSGSIPAKIMIVGENPGLSEELKGTIFSGQSGEELTRMLAEAGINRDECYLTNLCKVRPPNGELKHFFYSTAEAKTQKALPFRGLYPKQEILAGLAELEDEIQRVHPNIIIAIGNYAFWAVSQNCDITNKEKYKVPVGLTTWRGSVIPAHETYYNVKVLPTYHPSDIMRMWERRPITVHDFRRASGDSGFQLYKEPKYNFIVRPSYQQTVETLEFLLSHDTIRIAVDLETRLKHIACCGIAWSKVDAICIPFMTKNNLTGYWSELEEAHIVWLLFKLFTKPGVKVIGQNFAYDIQYIARRWGFIFPIHSDTLLNQHVLLPGTPKDLAYLASMFCEFYCYWKDEGKEWDPFTMNEDRLWIYNCKDAVNTLEADAEQQQVLDMWGLRPFQEFLMSMFMPVVRTMLRGVLIDMNLRKQLAMELLEQIMEHERWFTSIMQGINITKPGAKPWFGSPQQQQFLFFDLMKQPRTQSRKSKKDSVDDESLSLIAEREILLRPLISKLKEYRSLRIFYKNFVLMPLDNDNRARCSYNIGGTETYRLSSSEDAFGYGTNLQNIPKGNEE